MATEIERKYLVKDASWKDGVAGTRYVQGYLCTDPERTVRLRIAGPEAWVTIKGLTQGIARAEFEYPIPSSDAEKILDLCLRPLIEKIRYRIEYRGHTWEVDEFLGDNQGLVLAEIELGDAGEPLELPPWAGAEVSADPRYFNANLVARPFTEW
jgi:CYTH domain-containing protein